MFRTARRLDRALSGEDLTHADFRWPSLATVDLRGQRVIETVPRGKHLLTRLAGGVTIHSHLRMDGSWQVLRAGRRPPGTHTVRVVLGNRGSTAVGIQLGMLDVLATDREHTVVGHLGPDLLDPLWTEAHADLAAQNLASQPERGIGEALLDQRNLAGLGTIWTGEPLFALGIRPDRPVNEVPNLPALVATGRRLLRAAALGDIPPRLNVHYKRFGSPCRVCGTTIAAMAVGVKPQERRVGYCPTCQT